MVNIGDRVVVTKVRWTGPKDHHLREQYTSQILIGQEYTIDEIDEDDEGIYYGLEGTDFVVDRREFVLAKNYKDPLSKQLSKIDTTTQEIEV